MSSERITAEDEDLDYTRQMRRQLVESLIVKGEMPTDPKDRIVFLQALDGMDRAALGKKRIDADKELGNQQAQAAGILAELFRDSRTMGVGKGQRDTVPVLADDIAPTRLLPDELTSSNAGDNYEAFMNRTQGAEAQGVSQ